MTVVSSPSSAKPRYEAVKRVGEWIFVSGQLPVIDGQLSTGTVGADVDVDTARLAAVASARSCIELARGVATAADNLELVQIRGYVASTPAFIDHPAVIDAASDIFREALGARGEHARVAIGVAALPKGACVEVEALFIDRAVTD
ncbi:RidA family protein [Paenarthrobacter sp. NCHU4564]|uniref:RidA family protein n=1 Tax=Paenarthrobacter sp. NCHU4564 TaxID=3451353 RepID=UPI003F9D80FF